MIEPTLLALLVLGASKELVVEPAATSPLPVQVCRKTTLPPTQQWVVNERTGRTFEQRIDVDANGTTDVLSVSDDGGSGEASRSVTLALGGESAPIRAGARFSFYHFVAVNPVPDALEGKRHEQLRRAVENALFDQVCDRPEPSLEWLLDDEHHLRWYAGPARLPPMYTLYVTDAASLRRWRDEADLAGETSAAKAVWVTYLGHNHSRQLGPAKGEPMPRVLSQHGDRVLLGTAHGVILTNANRSAHAWLYVHAGGQKLRTPTVVSAALTPREAIVHLRLGPPAGAGQVRIDLGSGALSRSPRAAGPTHHDRRRPRSPE